MNTGSDRKQTVAIVYSHFPHYREAIFRELNNSEEFEFDFYFSRDAVDQTIAESSKIEIGRVLPALVIGPFLYQFGLHRKLLSGSYKAVIFLGNPYHISVWIYSLIARASSTRILFWTHGWLSRERGIRGILRSLFYRLADGLLLYGNRAREIGLEFGFKSRRLHVIYNSLDYDKQKRVRDELLQSQTAQPICEPYLLYVGRLVREVQLELLVDALLILKEQYDLSPRVLIVGAGPEQASLSSKCSRCSLNVHFCGPIYSEQELGALFINAVCVVSPGKVGLLAMHALAYGAIVVTHDNLDNQMPEFEALQLGVTGEVFREGDARSLAVILENVLARHEQRRFSNVAIAEIEAKYTPQKQRSVIEAALRQHINRF